MPAETLTCAQPDVVLARPVNIKKAEYTVPSLIELSPYESRVLSQALDTYSNQIISYHVELTGAADHEDPQLKYIEQLRHDLLEAANNHGTYKFPTELTEHELLMDVAGAVLLQMAHSEYEDVAIDDTAEQLRQFFIKALYSSDSLSLFQGADLLEMGITEIFDQAILESFLLANPTKLSNHERELQRKVSFFYHARSLGYDDDQMLKIMSKLPQVDTTPSKSRGQFRTLLNGWVSQLDQHEVVMPVKSDKFGYNIGRPRRYTAEIDQQSWIYLITFGEDDENNASYKIGYSSDLDRRTANLRTGNDKALRVIGAWKSPAKIVRTVEKSLHNRFADVHIRGEFFRLDSSLLQYMKTHLGTPEQGEWAEQTAPLEQTIGA